MPQDVSYSCRHEARIWGTYSISIQDIFHNMDLSLRPRFSQRQIPNNLQPTHIQNSPPPPQREGMHGLTRAPVWLPLSHLRRAALHAQYSFHHELNQPFPYLLSAGLGKRDDQGRFFSLWLLFAHPFPESIEWLIEEQAFSPSYDFSPPTPRSRQQVVPLSQSSCVSPVNLTEWGGGGRGAKLYGREKAWSSINHSIFYAHSQSTFIFTGTIYTHEQFNPIVSCTQIGPYQFTLSPHCLSSPPSPPPPTIITPCSNRLKI